MKSARAWHYVPIGGDSPSFSAVEIIEIARANTDLPFDNDHTFQRLSSTVSALEKHHILDATTILLFDRLSMSSWFFALWLKQNDRKISPTLVCQLLPLCQQPHNPSRLINNTFYFDSAIQKIDLNLLNNSTLNTIEQYPLFFRQINCDFCGKHWSG